jgi:hypothetical protein
MPFCGDLVAHGVAQTRVIFDQQNTHASSMI